MIVDARNKMKAMKMRSMLSLRKKKQIQTKKEIKHPVYVQNTLEFAENAYDMMTFSWERRQN